MGMLAVFRNFGGFAHAHEAAPAEDAARRGRTTTEASVAMGVLDGDLRFIEGNRALGAVFGVETVVGSTLAELGPAGARTDDLVLETLRTGRPVTVGRSPERITYYPVVGAEGSVVGLGAVGVSDDADERDLALLTAHAETDGLTGLVNHRVFQERLQVEVERGRRHGRPVSVALVDVDGFKQFNDTFGHQKGDEALRAVAAHLRAGARGHDTVARIGGDEFALLLPETHASAAQVVAERARDRIRRDLGNPGTSVTVSVGVCDTDRGRDAVELLRLADGALFWAKANGRDLVCAYDPEVVDDLSVDQRAARLLRTRMLTGTMALARAVDRKDASTILHSERVASLAGRLAEADGWPPERIAALRETALVHDVGKIGVPEQVLLKPGTLTDEEYRAVKAHAVLGAQIAGEVLGAEQTAWLRGHHERWDGTGYPDGLAGNEIPEGSLLLALADSWDVMTSQRLYSRSMTTGEAIAECRRCAGGQFSPHLVSILTEPGFERILRFFANEQRTRDRNEVLLADDAGPTFRIHCECGHEGCPAMLDVPAEEYRAVRQIERRYIVQNGHEIPEIEATLRATAGYAVVEKDTDAAQGTRAQQSREDVRGAGAPLDLEIGVPPGAANGA